MNDIAQRDENRIPSLLGVDSVLFENTVTAAVDAITHELLTRSSIVALTSIFTGSKSVPTGTAEALSTSQEIHSITIKALSTNTYPVYVGSVGVTSSTGFELLAGESISLDIDNIATVYVISSNASQNVRYIAI